MDFKQAEKRFQQLKAQFTAGDLSQTEFKTQLDELMLQDEQGDWWMIGYETEKWYRHDGKDWVQTDPLGTRSKISTPFPLKQEIGTKISDKSEGDQRSLWRFWKKEIVQSAIGIGIFILLFYLFRGIYLFRFWSPAFAVPFFFGLTFGPIVGVIVGAVGYILMAPLMGIPFVYYFSNFTLYSYATRGLIMGMAKVPINQFRSRGGIIRAEVFVIVSIIVTTILFTPFEFFIRELAFLVTQNLIPSLLGNLALIPISMVIYSFIISRIKK